MNYELYFLVNSLLPQARGKGNSFPRPRAGPAASYFALPKEAEKDYGIRKISLKEKQMIIHRDCFVKLAYRLQLASGAYVRGSAQQPEILTYVAGYKELLPALENQLLGLKPGDTAEFVIPAAQAFGERQPELQQEFSRRRFPADADLRPGMAVVPSPCAIEIAYPYTVVEVRDDVVVLDQNHPLAGEDLYYQVEILEVRAATPEELAPLQHCDSCSGDLESCHP